MKNLILTALAAVSLAAAPAAAQTTVRAGTQLSNLGDRVNAAGTLDVSGFNLFSGVNAGVEGRSDFSRNGVDEVTARFGPAFGFGRLEFAPTAQLGLVNVRNDGRDIQPTFGAGLAARLPLVERLSLVGSVNYRQAFSGRDDYRLTEATAGAEYALTPNLALDARYFNRSGTRDSSGLGLGATLRF